MHLLSDEFIADWVDDEFRKADDMMYEDAGVERWWDSEFSRLAGLKDNWDGYGAKPISDTPFTVATMVLFDLERNRVHRPTLVPTTQGGIQLEAHTQNGSYEIEIYEDGHVDVAFDSSDVPCGYVSRMIPSSMIGEFVPEHLVRDGWYTARHKFSGKKDRPAIYVEKCDWGYGIWQVGSNAPTPAANWTDFQRLPDYLLAETEKQGEK